MARDLAGHSRWNSSRDRVRFRTLLAVSFALVASGAIAAAVVLFPAAPGHLAGFVIAVGLGILLAHALARPLPPAESRTIWIVFWLGLVVRMSYVLLILLISSGPDWDPPGFYEQDGPFYHETGKRLAESWREGFFTIVPGNQWFTFHGLIYYIFGPSPLIIRFVNAVGGALIPVVVYRLASVLYGGTSVARYAAFLSLITPTLIHYSGLQVRDIMIALGMVGGAAALALLQQRVTPYRLLGLVASTVLVYMLRRIFFYVLLFIALLHLGVAVLARGRRALGRLTGAVTATLAVGALVSWAGFGRSGAEELGDLLGYYLWSIPQDLGGLEKFELYREGHEFISPNAFAPATVAYAVARSLFIPNLVYLVREAFDGNLDGFVFFPFGVFWMAITPLWILGIWRAMRGRFPQFLLPVALAVVLYLASPLGFLTGNDAPIRASLSAMPFFAILAASGITAKELPHATRVGVMGIYYAGYFGVSLLYFEFYTGLIRQLLLLVLGTFR